ncbi:MFS transporter, partial [Desulfosarcina cetonica]|uniref:MFS transporter n=1 Tax=Desulfosarcina cetonica TaxID=90730 RepID=UPI0006CF9C3E
LSQGIWGIRCALIVVGMAAGLYLPSGIATLTTIVHPRHWGKALSIHEIAPNVSFVAAPLLAEAMLGWVSWRSALCILGGLTLVLGLAFARFGKGGDFPGKVPSFGAFNTLLRLPAFWITMSLFMLGISATMGIFTMLPLFLINVHDMTRSAANELIGLSRVLAIGMSFISGWTSDRLGPKRTLIIVFLLNGTATILLGAVSTDWLRVLIFLQPLVAVCVFPPAFVVLSAIGPPNMRNVAVSLTVPAAFILGGGVMPMLIGMLGDRGHFAAGIIMVGAMLLVGAVLVGFLRSTPSEAVETAPEACPSATPEDA